MPNVIFTFIFSLFHFSCEQYALLLPLVNDYSTFTQKGIKQIIVSNQPYQLSLAARCLPSTSCPAPTLPAVPSDSCQVSDNQSTAAGDAAQRRHNPGKCRPPPRLLSHPTAGGQPLTCQLEETVIVRHIRLGFRHRVPLFHEDGWGPGFCQAKSPWGGDCHLGCSGHLGNLETGPGGRVKQTRFLKSVEQECPSPGEK